jgi:hypothetical protein
MLRIDLQQLATLRLEEAKSLLHAGHPSGAYHLAGLAIEAAIKSRLAGMVREHQFPDKKFTNSCYEHDPTKLIAAAQLESQLAAERAVNANFDANWALVKDWHIDSRYEVVEHPTASDLLNAIDADPDGILAWLRNHW